ncbi:hypothetical protein P7M09_28325, partial [Vibrio parahaemolyticus]|nr:hypothetical protein [Vibrio parahaemolyticus]
ALALSSLSNAIAVSLRLVLLLKKCFNMYISKALARTLFNFSRDAKKQKRPFLGRLRGGGNKNVMLI